MNGDKRNFSLSIWDHEDTFLCLLKPASGSIEGQSYNENLTSNIYGEETLSFTIPAYINNYKENEKWNYIFSEQKIRYIEYNDITNKPIKGRIKEFVLKHYEESRNGYEKSIQCECQSLAVYELSKIGWNINFDTYYVSQYEQLNHSDDYLTLDYWLKKIFYKETNLGRVSTTTEYNYLLQGLQLRDNEGYPISNSYSIDEDGNYYFERIEEPICEDEEIPQNYLNLTGWSWEIQAVDPRRLDKQIITDKIYEKPVINRYIEISPNNFLPHSYQCGINEEDSEKTLKPHPIEDYNSLRYVTDIKRKLISCERSNIFSIIQVLCEEFNVWAYFFYDYNEQGKIINKKILFKSAAVNDTITFDFSYGKNLQGCTRSIDSNDLVTKLIIPDTESNLNSNRILSIKQAVANQTGEGYIYNFDYFYNIGSLSRLTEEEKRGDISVIEHSDEYKINYHCGQLKKINTQITNIQNYLVPLYDRQVSLSTDLTVQEANIIGIRQNMSDINDKIAVIPEDQQIVESWSSFTTQLDYIGKLKTLTNTTTHEGYSRYINFGREDVLYNNSIEIQSFYLDEEGNLIEEEKEEKEYIPSYVPRYNTNWNQKDELNDETDFNKLEGNNIVIPEYSKIGEKTLGYIKGLYISDNYYLEHSWIRIRYKYAPLAYYYMLLKDYWDKLLKEKEKSTIISNNLQEINNKIINNEMILKNLLAQKNELILQFEKEYGIYIKEGYWEPSDYQSQINSEIVNTNSPKSIYEGFILITNKLSDLNLNESLHNYTYYIPLSVNADNIDINSIRMITYSPVADYEYTPLERNRGNDYEVYIDDNNQVIIAIAPSLIDTYQLYKYDQKFYKSRISYTDLQENEIQLSINGELDIPWTNFNSENSPKVIERYIYLSNDNILTHTLEIYGNEDKQENLLTFGTDYTYTFDYAGYVDGQRVDLKNQTSYNENITYDYITKITLKNSNKVNSFGNGPYIIKYSNETTLQFLYNDALATSDKYSTPQITYSISMLDISGLKGYENYKPILGQKVPIYDIEMRLNGYEGIITSISKELEKPENTQIELATYQTKFEDIFQKLTVTMTDIRYNQSDILNAASSFSIENGTIKADVFRKSLEDNDYLITLGVNNDITIERESGITLIDKDNNRAVKIIGNGIFLTDNYTTNPQWRTGITGEGINASALTVGNIDTKNISIWNASEGQVRFIWNEEGLFAYGEKGIAGDSSNKIQDFIDYNKFVKFSYNGLEFQDTEENIVRSALSLGWDGLKISAQQGSLELNAAQGLIIKDFNNNNNNNNIITRLELGKLDDGTIYGLRLRDNYGDPSFQSDSEGNLWLSKYIKVGGQYNAETGQYDSKPNAGIVGLQNNSDEKQYQMGLIRDSHGTPYWSNKIIRFWAGPQTKEEYLGQLNLTSETLNIPELNSFNDEETYPAFARFKVDEKGNIIASGIDVGGWIGQGTILASKSYEAILRSDGYEYIDSENKGYPVLAIGIPFKENENDPDDISGLNHNFRVYKDGSINIGNGQFIVQANGHVEAKDIIIGNSGDEPTSDFNVNDGLIGGLSINPYGLGVILKNSNNEITYRSGIYSNSKSVLALSSKEDNYVFLAGPEGDPSFYVTDKGSVVANDITITGSSGNWIINSSKFQVDSNGQIGAGTQLNTFPDIDSIDTSDNLYSFSVDSNGTIRFRGDIKAWDGIKWREGLNSGQISFYTTNQRTVSVEVCQGLIVDIRNV